jgi:CheY-like chemotaxis protein
MRTVLLVEDNPTDVFVIKEVIDRCELDLELRVATDGQDAVHYFQDLARAEKPFPALVLLDLNIPKVGGIEVLKHLRSTSPCSRIPVIVVTSSTAETDRIAVERLGAEAYFQKPTSLAAYMQLGQLIKQLLDLGSRRIE